jgi:hypothetical protein
MPGTYLLTYSVVNEDGNSATATRELTVYQAVAVTIPLELYSAIASYSQASSAVSALRNKSLPGYATGVDAAIQKLGSLATQLQPGDVDIVGAAFVQYSVTNFSILVNVSVNLYSPRNVHRQDILTFEGGWKGTAGSKAQHRRQLLSATEAHADSYPLVHQAMLTTQAPTTQVASGSTAGSDQLKVATAALVNLQQSLAALDHIIASIGCSEGGHGSACTGDLAPDGVTSVGEESTQASRRLLQTTTDPNLAAVLAALSVELGTNLTTQPLTPQAVDLLMVSGCGTVGRGQLLIELQLQRMTRQNQRATVCDTP